MAAINKETFCQFEQVCHLNFLSFCLRVAIYLVAINYIFQMQAVKQIAPKQRGA